MQILFYDPATPTPYDGHTLEQRALGGTEATIIRIAQALSEQHLVYVAQHCRARRDDTVSGGVQYISFATANTLKPEVVILLRHYRLAETVAKHFPQARLFLWLHNLPSKGLYRARESLSRHGYEVIGVSDFHVKVIQRRLKGKWLQRLLAFGKTVKIPVHRLYNPIADDLHPDKTPVQKNKLLFMSSPQKGLAQTLELFRQIRQALPKLELWIANPGYHHLDLKLPQGAHLLGPMLHQEVLKTLRESFCVFYPQNQRVETFGLIFAEANAVGTPVLANDFGAAGEILSSKEQLVCNCHVKQIVAKLKAWQKSRPQLVGQDVFRLTQVKLSWLALLKAKDYTS